MKAYIHIFFVALVVLFSSCDRSGVFEELDKDIPWEFHVVAVTDENRTQWVGGATVEVYLTKEDRDNGTNLYLSGQANDKGEIVFTLKDFDKQNKGPESVKGIYYLKVHKGNLLKDDLTRYLLMNSGATYQWVVLEPVN